MLHRSDSEHSEVHGGTAERDGGDAAVSRERPAGVRVSSPANS